jgi:hypothetical protein
MAPSAPSPTSPRASAARRRPDRSWPRPAWPADAVEDIIESAEVEPVTLKGFHRKLKDVVA